jgi:hypothetical protein
MLAAITNNPDVAFALSLVGLVLGVIVVITSRLVSLEGWAIIALGLAGVLAWWPS